MTHVWQVGHSQDGWFVDLINAPQWTFAAETLLDRVDAALGHRLCGNGWPDWMWQVPVGKPLRDEDDWLTNSVPCLLSHGFNSAWSWLIAQQTITATIPIPDTLGRELAPDLAFLDELDDTP